MSGNLCHFHFDYLHPSLRFPLPQGSSQLSPLLLGPVKPNLGAVDLSLVESSRVVCMVFLKGSHLLSENLETKLGGKSFQTCLARKVGGLNMQDVFS